jgi:hypothetical protein
MKLTNYDCIVVGAGPSGIMASITLGRKGLKTLLIEKESNIGGTNINCLVSPFMGFTDSSLNELNKGLLTELILQLKSINGTKGHIKDPIGFSPSITPIDLNKLKEVYENLLTSSKVKVIVNSSVVDAIVENNAIKSILIQNKDDFQVFSAKYYCDATGDGILAGITGIPYIYGRELDNKTQPSTLLFTMNNVNFDKIREELKNNPTNFTKSDISSDYLAVSGFFNEVILAKENNDFTINRDRVLFFQTFNDNEVLINTTRIFIPNVFEETSDYMIEGKKQIKQLELFFRKYIKGFENSKVNLVAKKLGIRESRHFICLSKLTETNITNGIIDDDTCCLCAYPIDIHSPIGSDISTNDKIIVYGIPYKTMVPEKINNLLITGRAINATHEASASSRITPTCMALGESAGKAIYLSFSNNISLKNIKGIDLKGIN